MLTLDFLFPHEGRISIQLESQGNKSAILFSHDKGLTLLRTFHFYLENLRKETKGLTTMPLERFEASTVLFDFISTTLEGPGFYLTSELSQGDNSNHGHYLIHIRKCEPTTYTLERENIYMHDYVIEELGFLSQKLKHSGND